jgi:hypothetical protein
MVITFIVLSFREVMLSQKDFSKFLSSDPCQVAKVFSRIHGCPDLLDPDHHRYHPQIIQAKTLPFKEGTPR